jgi:8-oxo-dGTP diphosphatase
MNRALKAESKELLLADYKYLCDSFWKNEEAGEKRVQFFITLVTAVLAATATLIAKASDQKSFDSIDEINLFALSGLLVFGMITLLRILKRNEVTDGYKCDLDEIRERFKDYFDPCGVLSGYEPFGGASKNKFLLRKIGGLSHIVATLNSIILVALSIVILLIDKRNASGASVALITLNIHGIVLLIFGIFVVSLLAQLFFIKKTEKQSMKNIKASRLTHAGGIVWKKVNADHHFLIITAKDKPLIWVLPKGHIDEIKDIKKDKNLKKNKGENKYEDPAETAIREVREEAGIKARICSTLGYSNYEVGGKLVRVKFYLMEYIGDEIEIKTEKRQKRWCTFEEAVSILSYEDLRRLLRFAHRNLSDVVVG